MKGSKGFFLVQELLIFGLCCLLLTGVAVSLAKCLSVQRENLLLQECLISAEQALSGEEALLPVKRSVCEQGEIKLVELEVQHEQVRFNLLVAQ